jgi:hypothetical protein
MMIPQNTIVRETEKYFHCLFQAGFEINQVNEEPRNVVWCILDGKCRIRVGRDGDGHAYLSIAPKDTPTEFWQNWIYLEVVVYYLSSKQKNLDYLDSKIDRQLALGTLAANLQQYLNQILDIFSGKDFEKYRQEFETLRQEMNRLQVSKS